MTEAFKQFLKSIKPTNKGMLAVLLVTFLIPILADVFLVFVSISNRDLMYSAFHSTATNRCGPVQLSRWDSSGRIMSAI